MQKAIFYILALLGLVATTAASAADLPRRDYAPPPPMVTPFTWEGAYLGLNTGFSKNSMSTPTGSYDLNAASVGIGGGYNYAWKNFVFGLEGDINYNPVETSSLGQSLIYSTDWSATGRARIGYAFGTILPYITGGIATDKVKGKGLVNDTITRYGWVMGAGIEYALTHNWSLKAEYLRMTLDKENLTGTGDNVAVKSDIDIIRTGVNYRF